MAGNINAIFLQPPTEEVINNAPTQVRKKTLRAYQAIQLHKANREPRKERRSLLNTEVCYAALIEDNTDPERLSQHRRALA